MGPRLPPYRDSVRPPYAATLRVASTSRSASWESSVRLKLSELRSRSSKLAEGRMSRRQPSAPARTLAPAAALAACEEVLLRCSTVGYAGAALTARLRSASCALEAGDVERALVHAHVDTYTHCPN